MDGVVGPVALERRVRAAALRRKIAGGNGGVSDGKVVVLVFGV